jgi:D-glycero-alpha-D-manno-heptose-7-phosphate kinase
MPYAAERGGMVLNATIDRYAYASLTCDGRQDLAVRSLDYDLSTQFDLEQPLVYDGQLDLVKSAIKWMNREAGITPTGCGELQLNTDAPPGSGLGSSSAVVVAMLNAFSAWRGIPLTVYELARLAYELEREDLGIKGGMQDQYAAAFGGFNFIEFGATGVVVNPLRVSPRILNELQYCLLLCYTGGTRLSAHIIDAQVRNYQLGESEVLDAMQQLKELTVLMKNALVLGNLSEFGTLLHEAWVNKKKMAGQISTPHLDEIYEEARRSGALGGKVTGAGGGGYMFFYCPGETRHEVGARLTKMGLEMTRFAFEPSGAQTWEAPDR